MFEHHPKQSTSKPTYRHTNFVNGKWELDLLEGEKAFAYAVTIFNGPSIDFGNIQYHWCLQQHLRHDFQESGPWVYRNHK